MLDIDTPINETQNFNNFSMKERSRIEKINLRGDVNNRDFISKIEKVLGVVLSVEVGSIVTKDEMVIICTGPNEWLIVGNNKVEQNNNNLILENILFEAISKKNLGAVTNVSDQFTIFSLNGSNVFEILSKSSPFNFDLLINNYSTQTLLNNIGVTIIKKDDKNVDLLVRRSFSEHMWDWIKDSANFS